MKTTTTRKIAADKKSGKAVEGEVRVVAKSLHTITVLVQVARLHGQFQTKQYPKEKLIASAMETLGLAGRPDPYELEAKALKLLQGVK